MSERQVHWLSVAEANAVIAYVRRLADLLGLKDWEIIIAGEPETSNTVYARIKIADAKKFARIYLDSEWATMDPQQKRRTLVHELLHCHDALADHLVEMDLKEHLGLAHGSIVQTYQRLREYAVDALALSIAPLIPPYPELKPPKRKRP